MNIPDERQKYKGYCCVCRRICEDSRANCKHALVGPNVKVNRHFAACRVWARILAQTWRAAKCPVERVVRPRLKHNLTIDSKRLRSIDRG